MFAISYRGRPRVLSFSKHFVVSCNFNDGNNLKILFSINDSPIAIRLTDSLHFKILGIILFFFVTVWCNTVLWGHDNYCLVAMPGRVGREAMACDTLDNDR